MQRILYRFAGGFPRIKGMTPGSARNTSRLSRESGNPPAAIATMEDERPGVAARFRLRPAYSNTDAMQRQPGSQTWGKSIGRLPLEVFRFFDAAGRHQSFAKAARELGLTPGAVAHRIRMLEQHLGVELFERQSHGLTLSPRGQALLVEVQQTLSALDRTTERFRAGSRTGALKLVAVEAFAEMWLMPRLAAFRRAHPEVAIEFETDHHEVDPARREFDVWIAFTGVVPRTVQSEVLFEEALVPVCSPAFLASRGRPVHPVDLHGWPLLYDLAWDDYWAYWFAHVEAGAPDLSRASGYRLYSMMIHAALEGMGVALGHFMLIAPYLERGALVGLFDVPVAAPARYFLALAPGSEERPEAQAFRNWLRVETRKGTAGGKLPPPPVPRRNGESPASMESK